MSSKFIRAEQCPDCASRGRDTAKDNLAVYDDGHSYCFACGYKQLPEGYNNLDDTLVTYEFLPHREIPKSAFRHYDVKVAIDKDGKPLRIGFPYPNGSYKIRLFDQKEFFSKPSPSGESISGAGLFGRDRFEIGSHKHVIVTEGEYDALAIYSVLGVPTVSVQSSSSAVRDCTADRAFLNSFERVYLAFDGDVPGRDATAGVSRLFDYDKVFDIRFTKFKDGNEYLLNGCRDELAGLYHSAGKYCPENIISDLATFRELLGVAPERGVAYPWPTLDEMTLGMHRGQTILVTALEGVGKTEVMHALEYQLLSQTPDNVGAVFLEEDPTRNLQALSGLVLKAPVHLPDSGYSTDQVSAALESLVQRDGRLHVMDHYGDDDPEHLLETIRFLVAARGCTYVLLDHVGMVVSGGAAKDERKALDRIMTKLEMMVKELNFCLIVVSHVNDDGYTRGSRYISKIAHTRIDLFRDILADDPITKLKTYLTVSKNRYGRKTGRAGCLLFDLATHSYTEIEDDGPSNSNSDGAGRSSVF
jgi:twinkle protein